jgi:plastocyanin domain-containing protein
MQKDSKTALIFCGVAVGMLVLFFALRNNNPSTVATGNEVISNENGTQIIELAAKGGFTPSFVEAKAGVPTELRVATNGTYDCSSTLVIPSLGYQATLKPTGTEAIPLTAAQAKGTLEGTCGMGMYKFQIAFK